MPIPNIFKWQSSSFACQYILRIPNWHLAISIEPLTRGLAFLSRWKIWPFYGFWGSSNMKCLNRMFVIYASGFFFLSFQQPWEKEGILGAVGVPLSLPSPSPRPPASAPALPSHGPGCWPPTGSHESTPLRMLLKLKPRLGFRRNVSCWSQFQKRHLALPDRAFHNSIASRSGARRIVRGSGTSWDGFWDSEIGKRLVGFRAFSCSIRVERLMQLFLHIITLINKDPCQKSTELISKGKFILVTLSTVYNKVFFFLKSPLACLTARRVSRCQALPFNMFELN